MYSHDTCPWLPVQSALICPHRSQSRHLLCSVSCELSVHTTPSPRQRTQPCQWCPVDLREKAQATNVEGRGERRGYWRQSWTLLQMGQLSNTTSWQLRVMHRDNRAGMSGWETYLGEEPFWVEGWGMGPVGTKWGEGELQGTETMAEVYSVYRSWDAHVTRR